MSSLLSTLLTTWLLLHPGHSTRVELQWKPDRQQIEMAMRIDHADLESALRKRLGHAVRVEDMTAAQAQAWIGSYLRETLRFDEAKLSSEQFSWVGWERKADSSWSYVALSVERPTASVALRILSLLEVEADLNHVVTIRRGNQQQSVVLSKQKPVVTIVIEY